MFDIMDNKGHAEKVSGTFEENWPTPSEAMALQKNDEATKHVDQVCFAFCVFRFAFCVIFGQAS